MQGAMTLELAAQVAGWLGSAVVVGAFWCADDRRMAVALALGLGAMSLHFAGLGAATAAASCALGAARGVASLRWQGSRRLALAFCVAGASVAIPTWDGVPSALALVAGTASTVFLLTLAGAPLRLCMAGASAVWIAHHILVGSMPALAMECLVALGNIVTAARILLRSRKNETYPLLQRGEEADGPARSSEETGGRWAQPMAARYGSTSAGRFGGSAAAP